MFLNHRPLANTELQRDLGRTISKVTVREHCALTGYCTDCSERRTPAGLLLATPSRRYEV